MQRPDPEQMLARARAEEQRARRGRLKVWFGMAPGVGKTYAMLQAARRAAREGVDVVVGLVETHGRSETTQLLEGLETLPRRKIRYKEIDLEELDLDAVLRRRPAVVLVDELAHSNAPGSRFAKRWQDVDALRDAGIDVHTTLNVQHVESLSDVVHRITGVPVRETVPDATLEGADEIELVDLPPEALLARLRAGKVYVPETMAMALDSFFRAGNLTALREIALRRTAELVDEQLRRYKTDRGIRSVWPVAERFVVAISQSPNSEPLLRSAKRMAARRSAELLAVYVETPRLRGQSAEDRERVLRTLRLAERLGAETATLRGTDVAAELLEFARQRHATAILIGRSGEAPWQRRLRGSLLDRILQRCGDIDVYVVHGEEEADPGRQGGTDEEPAAGEPPRRLGRQALLTMAVVAACTGLGAWIARPPDLSELAMLYLAGVVLTALVAGRIAAIVAAVASVAAFNYFFTEPRLTFRVDDSSWWLTFAVMLAVGTLVASLVARAREEQEAARHGERRTAALYGLARDLSVARDREDLAAAAVRHAHDLLGCDAVLLAPSRTAPDALPEVLAAAGDPDWLTDRERGVARWSFEHGRPAGHGTPALPGASGRHVPLATARGKWAVLSLHPHARSALATTEGLLLLETLGNQIAAALERVSLLESRQQARLEVETERLRAALLSSVSHDLRTPLATIAGSATALRESSATLSEEARRELLDGIAEESDRMARLVENLIFATRLEAGGVRLRTEWTSVEELVGLALGPLRERIGDRPLLVDLDPGDLLIAADTSLLPQAIQNLVDNALRYSPPGSPVTIQATRVDGDLLLSVADRGPGLAEGEAERIFQRFYRGRAGRREAKGMGLGLTVCKGVVEAHGGRIWAENAAEGGARFWIRIPRGGEPPAPPAAEAERS